MDLTKHIAIGCSLGMVAMAGVLGFQKWSNDRKVVELQNQLADRDKTIEVKEGVYVKLATQMSDLRLALDTSNDEVKRLADEAEKNHAQMLSVTNALVELKKQVADGKGQQQELPGGRLRVDFNQDFGFARVDGYTITNPPEYHLSLSQGIRPLHLSIAVTQQADMSWRTLASSSDPNIAIDIGVTAVNPYILVPRWYERLKLSTDLGIGGDGVLVGVGGTLQLGQFDVGPKIWAITLAGGHVFYGGTLSWAPFKR